MKDGLLFIDIIHHLDEAYDNINDANRCIEKLMGNKHIVEQLKLIKTKTESILSKIDTDEETIFEFEMINNMMDEAELIKSIHDRVV